MKGVAFKTIAAALFAASVGGAWTSTYGQDYTGTVDITTVTTFTEDVNLNGVTLTIKDGGTLQVGSSSDWKWTCQFGVSTLNLEDGGIFESVHIRHKASAGLMTINFNGGTWATYGSYPLLDADTDAVADSFSVGIGAKGGTIQSDYDVTMLCEVKSLCASGTTDGGLTKTGSGKLTLSVVPTFTGAITVQGGSVVLPSGTSYKCGQGTQDTVNDDNTITLTPKTGTAWSGASEASTLFSDDANWYGGRSTACQKEIIFNGQAGKTVTFDGVYNTTSYTWVGDGSEANPRYVATDGVHPLVWNTSADGAGIVSSDKLGVGDNTDQTGALKIEGGTYQFANAFVGTGSGAKADFEIDDGALTITGIADFAIGSGTANFVQKGGTFTVNSGTSYWAADGTGKLTASIQGGSTIFKGELVLGNNNTGTGGSSTIDISNGGLFQVGTESAAANLIFRYGSNAININNGGTLAAGSIKHDISNGTAAINLNGGKLLVVSSDSTVNLFSDSGDSALTLAVGASGGTIDVNGHDVTIAAAIGGTGKLTINNTGTTASVVTFSTEPTCEVEYVGNVSDGTFYWNGSADSEWTNGANWSYTADGSSVGRYPNGAEDKAIFNSAATVFASSAITVGEIQANAAVTLAAKLTGTTAIAKTGSGTLTLTGINASTGAFNVQEGEVKFVSSIEGITTYFDLDASDSSTVELSTDEKVTKWTAKNDSTICFTNDASVMTTTTDYFGGKTAVRSNSGYLQSSFSNMGNNSNKYYAQAFLAAVRLVSEPTKSGAFFWSCVNTDSKECYIGQSDVKADYSKWCKKKGTSRTYDNIWQNGELDNAFNVADKVVSVLGYSRYSNSTYGCLGGASGDLAIGEVIAFRSSQGDPNYATRLQIESYLGNKWNIDGAKSIAAVPVTMTAGTTLDLGGTTQSITSLSGSGTVTNGKLVITDAISVAAGSTLVISYGSTYTVSATTVATVDETAGTVTLQGKVATVDGTAYGSFEDAKTAAGGTKIITLCADVGTVTLNGGDTMIVNASDYNIVVNAATGCELSSENVEGGVKYTSTRRSAVITFDALPENVTIASVKVGEDTITKNDDGSYTVPSDSTVVITYAAKTAYALSGTNPVTLENVSGEVNVTSDNMPTAERTATTFTWSDAKADHTWSNAGNWLVDEAAVTVSPTEQDTVVFPTTETAWTVMLTAAQTVTKVTFNGPVSLSGGIIVTSAVEGSGNITLGDAAGFGNSLSTELKISNPLKIDASEDHPARFYRNNGAINVASTVTGSGTLRIESEYDNYSTQGNRLTGDLREFAGHVIVPNANQYANRNNSYINGSNAYSEKARWTVSNGGKGYFFGLGAGTYKFGILEGWVAHNNQSQGGAKIYEIGAKGGDFSLGGVFFSDNSYGRYNTDSYKMTIRKMGSGTMTFTGSRMPNYEVKEGSIRFTSNASLVSYIKSDNNFDTKYTEGDTTVLSTVKITGTAASVVTTSGVTITPNVISDVEGYKVVCTTNTVDSVTTCTYVLVPESSGDAPVTTDTEHTAAEIVTEKLAATSTEEVKTGIYVGNDGQQVGIVAITNGMVTTIVAVPFSGKTAADIVSTRNLVTGDKLYAYDAAKGWYFWTLTDGAWSDNVTYTDSQTDPITSAASAKTFAAGDAFMLQRVGTDADLTKPFYIYGTPASVSNPSLTAGSTTPLANPKMTDLNLDTAVENPSTSDRVVVPGNNMQIIYTYVEEGTTKGWQEPYIETVSGHSVTKRRAASPIQAGTGFWYKKDASSTATIDYTK